MSTRSVITTCRLDNGLDLLCLDDSKQIAADRWFVCVRVQMNIPIEKKWFGRHPVDDEVFQHIRRKLGDSVLFEQKKERNFISDDQKSTLVKEICDSTVEMAKQYLSHDGFAAKYILKRFAEQTRHY
jgi:hypothetical protein